MESHESVVERTPSLVVLAATLLMQPSITVGFLGCKHTVMSRFLRRFDLLAI